MRLERKLRIKISLAMVWMVACLLILAGCNLPNANSTSPFSRLRTQTAAAQMLIEPLMKTAAVDHLATSTPSPLLTPTLAPTFTFASPAQGVTLTPLAYPYTLKFKPGGTTVMLQALIRSSERQVYLLRALAGQTLIVSAASAGNDVFVDVSGLQGGQTLLSASAGLTSWSGKLPQSEDYQITLSSQAAEVVYFLEVTVPAEVVLKAGSGPLTLEGNLEVDQRFPEVLSRVRYRLDVGAGQTLVAKLSAPLADNLNMAIYGQQDGQPYLRYEVKNGGYEGTLPVAQGYFLDVVAVGGKSSSYTLTLELR